MCFNVAKGSRKAKITTKDIHCLKVLKVTKDGLFSPALTSKNTLWKEREVHKAPDMVRYGAKSIDAGLHSMKTFAATKDWMNSWIERKVYHAVIPAGSLYWENKKHYVSDALYIVSDIPITSREWRKILNLKK